MQTRTLNTLCTEQAQTFTTQHATLGMQSDDTPAASNDVITARVDDIIKQIYTLVKQGGSKLDTANNSWGGEGGLDRSIILGIKQKGRKRESQLKYTHQREYIENKMVTTKN